MRRNAGFENLIVALVATLVLLSAATPVRADMSAAEANKPYSVPFQDWVYLYLSTEFLQAAPAAPDYTIGVKQKIVDNQVRFVVTGYYFDTKLGRDWYRRYGSQVESSIAMLCHNWNRQGHRIILPGLF